MKAERGGSRWSEVKTFDALASPNPFKGLHVAKVRFKKKPSLD
jgi:hypothetical protein